MFSFHFVTFLALFFSIGSLSASSFSEHFDINDYRDPLAWKAYPKSDYGYKPSVLQCIRQATKLHSVTKDNCCGSEQTCEDKAKYCDGLINCGYGYPDTFDGRLPSPYKYNLTGFIPTNSCLPFDYVNSKGKHFCDRECDGKPQICYYRLHLQSSEAHHPYYCSEKCKRDKDCPSEKCILTDGERTIVTVYNNMLPGPTIAVCVGDTVVVDLVNHLSDFKLTHVSDKALEESIKEDMKIFKVRGGDQAARKLAREISHRHIHMAYSLKQGPDVETVAKSMTADNKGDPILVPDFSAPGEDTTCHFHGALMEDTPQSDGPPGVTQYGIPHGAVYRYRFTIDEGRSYFYHAHTGWQRGQGAFGALLTSEHNDPNCKLYDFKISDHCFIITDWSYNNEHSLVQALINSFGCNLKPNATNPGYMTMMNFEPNKRYFMSFIFNGIGSTKVRCWIDGLKFLMTGVDGHNIRPVEITSWVLGNGERVEGVVNFNQGIRNHFVKCIILRNTTIQQYAILHVRGAPKPPTCKELPSIPDPSGLEYNTENAAPGTNGTITTSELRGLFNMHPLCLEQENVEQIFIDMSVSARGVQINKITDELPEVPYLCQYYRNGYIDETNLCNEDYFKAKGIDCGAANVTCRCNHVMTIEENKCAEIICMGPHPLHIHGYYFHVIAQGKTLDNTPMTREKFLQYDRDGLIKRNLKHPPRKDTVSVPSNGYTVIRFPTTNPGFWKIHCHIELHGNSGMSFALWVKSKNENIKKRLKNHYCEPLINNVCKGKYVKMRSSKYGQRDYSDL